MTAPWDDPRIQRGMAAQLALRRARIAAGERPLGWKVGFGAPAMRAQLGISAPLVGFLMQGARVPSGGSVSLNGWARPIAEPEIAVHMGADLPGGGDRAGAAGAIAALGPAIELVDSDQQVREVEAILRGNVFQRHVVLGGKDAARAGGDTAGLTAHIVRRGVEAARVGDTEAATGKIVDIVRHVADVLAAFGERLAAGDVIIAGSVTPPLLIEADETEVAYELQPIGRIAVAFTR